MYFYVAEARAWKEEESDGKMLAERCLDFYCKNIEIQPQAVFAFILCWNRVMSKFKPLGEMIAKIMWENRHRSIIVPFPD